jgi:hypothetical protein
MLTLVANVVLRLVWEEGHAGGGLAPLLCGVRAWLGIKDNPPSKKKMRLGKNALDIVIPV